MSNVTKLAVEMCDFNKILFNHVGNSRSGSNTDIWNNGFQPHVTVDYVFSDQGVNLDHYTDCLATGWGRADIYHCHCGIGFVPFNFTNIDLTRVPYFCHS